MNNTATVITTKAGEALIAQMQAENKVLVIDKFIFANVPNRPAFPDRDDVVPVEHVVHESAVHEQGRLTENSVIYSTTLASNVGPFSFNWSGLFCSEHNVLVAINFPPPVDKTVDAPGITGNTLVRSFVMEYKGIAETTNITVDPSSWQYDAHKRMSKMDNDTAQAIIDQNGKDWFIDDGFIVTPQSSAYSIKAGAGYASGHRISLDFDRIIQVPEKPAFIYVDAFREGSPTGEWQTKFTFVVAVDEKDDYTDPQGVNHFVCKIAQVFQDGSVGDMRGEGEVASKVYVKDIVNNEAIIGIHDPRYYGAKPNDPDFDCLPMLIKARESGTLHLREGFEWFVSDEFILTSGLKLITDTNSKISAMDSGLWYKKKAVVRCAYNEIGITPNVNNLIEQIVNLNHSGKLICNANGLAGYGFYARALTNESVIDDIEGINATVCAVTILTSWFFSVKTRLFGKKSKWNVSLGVPLSGEIDDVFVNAVNFPTVNSYGLKQGIGIEYDPINGTYDEQIAGAGVLLGRGLGNSIGNLTAQNRYGAGLVTANALSWSIQSLYLESCGISDKGENISLLVSTENKENHTLNVNTLHLAGGAVVLSRTTTELVDIKTLYRFDNIPSFHEQCPNNSFKLANGNYYTKLPYNYEKPPCILSESADLVCSIDDFDVSAWTTKKFSVTKLTKGKITIVLDKPAPNDIQFIISGESGNDYAQINQGLDGIFNYTMLKTRNTGKVYTISMGVISNENCYANLKIQDSNTYW